VSIIRPLVALAASVSLAAVSAAQPQSFASRSQTIRAGVVILDADKASASSHASSAAPFAWYNLDANRRIKPAGWNIVNPYAPSILTGLAQVTRWTALNNTAQDPGEGTQLRKSTAPYWEVFLSQVSDEALASYDVLLVAPRFYVSLNPLERERLRKFVDGGGVLWVEAGGLPVGGVDIVNGFPIGFSVGSFSNTVTQADYTQPLLSRPLALSAREVESVNAPRTFSARGFVEPRVTGSLMGYYPELQQNPQNEYRRLQPVLLANGVLTAAIGRIGDGLIVYTSRGAALKLNQTLNSTTQNANFAGQPPVLDADGVASAKFAVNVISLGTQFRQAGGGSRKANSTAISVGAPLMRRFGYAFPAAASGTPSAPVLYKGIMLVSQGTTLSAYDANPNQDLDRDGDPDDGRPDLSLGSSQDLLWTAEIGRAISAPACLEVANPTATGGPVDQVVVVDADGTLQRFDVFNRDSSTGFIDKSGTGKPYQSIAPPNSRSVPSTPILAPTTHENQIYVLDRATNRLGAAAGRMWIADARTGLTFRNQGSPAGYAIGGFGSDVVLPEFTASPTVGYIPILDNSGGVDKVLYAPFKGSGAVGPAGWPGLVSIWLGARGERPASYTTDGPVLQVTTRASQQGGLPIARFGIRLTVIDEFGNPWPAAEMAKWFEGTPSPAGGGVINFPMTPDGGRDWKTIANKVDIRIDYNIDLSQRSTADAGVMQSVVRGQLNLPTTNNATVIGSVAMSPRGTIYTTLSNRQSGGGGTFYAFREEGRGQFRCVTRYDLYDSHTIQMNQVAPVRYDEVLFDKDPVDRFLPAPPSPPRAWPNADRRLKNFVFTGSPSVRNGQVFVTARANKTIRIGAFAVPFPVTLLLAFRAEPETPEFRVGDLPDGSTIVQPDLAKSAIKAQPEQQSILQSGAFTYEPERGILRLENLMNVARGPVQNSISLSQPIIVRRPNAPDALVEPDAISGRWSPLLWFAAIQGMEQLTSTQGLSLAPLVTGDTVFVAGSSMVPDVLSGKYTGVGIPKSVGVVTAFDSEISPNSPWLTAKDPDSGQTGPYRPWQKQLWTLRFENGTPVPSTHQRWPLLTGIQDLSDYIVRLNQTTLPNSPTTLGIAGGEGTFVAWSQEGIHTFSRSDFIVCDEGRVAIFDASGNALYTSSAAASTGEFGEGASANVKPLVRPTKAYPVNEGELLVVDTGANRIARLSLSGTETRSITGFKLDPTYVAAGYAANEATSFKAPQDVVTYAGYVTKGEKEIVTAQQPLEYWVHYLVADTGNRRLVELIDRFEVQAGSRRILNPITVDGTPQLGVLLWHSPANVSGANFDYTSVSRVYVPEGTGRFVYVAGTANQRPTRRGVGFQPPTESSPTTVPGTVASGGNGGVIVFDPLNPAGVQVINQLNVPDTSAAKYWNEATQSFAAVSSTPTTDQDAVLLRRRMGGPRPFAGINSVTTRIGSIGGSARVMVMVADSTGVYEFPLPAADDETGAVIWMLPNEAYRVLRRADNDTGPVSAGNPRNLRATYARRLDSGDVLIVNGFAGKTRGNNDFLGEIVQLDGGSYNNSATNLGFSISSIRAELGPVQGTRGLILPLFADRR
jgi:hypothetical protein